MLSTKRNLKTPRWGRKKTALNKFSCVAVIRLVNYVLLFHDHKPEYSILTHTIKEPPSLLQFRLTIPKLVRFSLCIPKVTKPQHHWLGSRKKRSCSGYFSSILQNRGLLNCQPGRTRPNNNRHFKILIIPSSSCPTPAWVMSCTPTKSSPHFHCWTDCRIILSNLILRKSSAGIPDEKLLRIYLLS